MSSSLPIRPLDKSTVEQKADESFREKLARFSKDVLSTTGPTRGTDDENANRGEEVEQDDGGMECIPCDEPEEARRAIMARDIQRPSAEEIALHRVTHLPYRPWCADCVAGKGREEPHRRTTGKDSRQFPTVLADYMFLARKRQDEAMTREHGEDGLVITDGTDAEDLTKQIKILNVKDDTSGALRAHRVPKKGITDQSWVTTQVCEDMAVWGHSTVIFKTDQENAMQAIQAEVLKQRAPNRTILENSPKGDSKANGSVERGNQSLAGQIRVLFSALSRNLNSRLGLDHPIISWMVEHAAYLISHYQVGRDGRTPYERLKGKKTSRELCEFGESIRYMPLKSMVGGQGKLSDRYLDGIFLTICERTSEVFVGTGRDQ